MNALCEAGERARGGTAVVTLEPCNHHGRTPPCTEALIAAGVATVYYGVRDPNLLAQGGAEALTNAGIAVHGGLCADEVEMGPLRAWLHRQRKGRPHVTWKFAASLDGRSAAADGTSQWITGPAGTGPCTRSGRGSTRSSSGREQSVPTTRGSPLDYPTARSHRGNRCASSSAGATFRPRPECSTTPPPTLRLRTRDPNAVLDALHDYDDVQLEGGPTLAGGFLAAHRVDRIQAYIAPVLLGAGAPAVQDAGVGTIGQALRFRREWVETIGTDICSSTVPAETNHADRTRTRSSSVHRNR